MEIFNHHSPAVSIHFTEVASPVDPRLTLCGELLDANGRRAWAGFGRTQSDILRAAATWLDDCHGRAGHTPAILVDDTWPVPGLAASIQQEVQAGHARQLVRALIGNRA